MSTNPITAEHLAALEALTKLINDSQAAAAPTGGPTVAEAIDTYLRLVRSDATRRTYATHLQRLRDGVAPICNQSCEPCSTPIRTQPLDENGESVKGRQYVFECRCSCRKCCASRIELAPLGERPLNADTVDANAFRVVGEAALRIAKKSGAYANQLRARKGKPPKKADGFGAQGMALAALRSLVAANAKWMGGYDGHDVKKPSQGAGDRRAMLDFELVELCEVTELGGDDPELDCLLVRFALECGPRRCGASGLTVQQLNPVTQMITVCDKGRVSMPMPASKELIDDLIAHAVARGGSQCDSASRGYKPDSAVFWQKRHQNGKPVPMTDRRFDTLAARWQAELDWASQQQVGYHHLRHTMSERLKASNGQHYAKRFLRHRDSEVTDRYGRCTDEQLARALSSIFGYEHPLVHGIDERRNQSLSRLGLRDG